MKQREDFLEQNTFYVNCNLGKKGLKGFYVLLYDKGKRKWKQSIETTLRINEGSVEKIQN